MKIIIKDGSERLFTREFEAVAAVPFAVTDWPSSSAAGLTTALGGGAGL
jgi:hypothetical protein